jgi:hypothetical protein
MRGLTARTVAIAAIGLGIGWLVVREPSLTHDSLSVVVLAAILVGSAALAGLVARMGIVRRTAAKAAEFYDGGSFYRFVVEAAFGACAALAWSIGLAVALRS